MSDKKEIRISEVRELLNQGKTRKEIAEHFGRSQQEMAQTVWQHPKLKNAKRKTAPGVIEIIDDEEEAAVAEATGETASEAVTDSAPQAEEVVSDEAVEQTAPQAETEQAPVQDSDDKWA